MIQKTAQENRYLVTIFCKDKLSLRALAEYDLDLVGHSSVRTGADETFNFCIDGILNADQIDLLVRKGYEVRIRESTLKRQFTPVSIIDAETWMKEAENNFNRTHQKIK